MADSVLSEITPGVGEPGSDICTLSCCPMYIRKFDECPMVITRMLKDFPKAIFFH